MNSLRALVAELQEEVATGQVATIIREILDKFFGEYDLPFPKLTFVNSSKARWLARCKWFKDALNTEIEVQRSVLSDEKSLRRALTHELIHHWQFLRLDQSDAIAMAKLGLKRMDDGHGQSFMQYAQKINAIMGPDYVTKVSDQSYDTSKVPPFYILVQPHTGGRFGYSIAQRPSAKQKEEIQARIAQRQAKLFRITDGRFFAGAAPIKRLGGYVLPKDSEGEMAKFLADLYNNGTEARAF